jgi:hypothetical protein
MVHFSLHAYVHVHVHVHVLCCVCKVSTSVTRCCNICTACLSFLSCITLTLTFHASITANHCSICDCMVWRVMLCHVMSCHVMSCHVMALSDIITSDTLSCPTTALRPISVMLTISVIVKAVSAFLDKHLHHQFVKGHNITILLYHCKRHDGQ